MTRWAGTEAKACGAPLGFVRPEHKTRLANFKSLAAADRQVTYALLLKKLAGQSIETHKVAGIVGLPTTRRILAKVKAIGPGIGRGGSARPEAYDPDAIDGDEDGRVQDNTPFERPATPRKKTRIPKSLTSPRRGLKTNPAPLSIRQESLKLIRERFKAARQRRRDIHAEYLKKRFGLKRPPPWEKSFLSIDQILEKASNPSGWRDIQRWVLRVYGHDEIQGKKYKFRTRFEGTESIVIADQMGHIYVNGDIEAFNPETQEWEAVGVFQRLIDYAADEPEVINETLAFGSDAFVDTQFSEDVKNDGFATVFNGHAFMMLKGSGFKRAIAENPSWDGMYVWARAGFRQRQTSRNDIKKWAESMQGELEKYREAKRLRVNNRSVIRTDLDAQLIEYLLEKAKRNKYDPKKSPHQHDYIMAVSGDVGKSEDDQIRLINFFGQNMPISTASFDFTDVNVPRDPRRRG